VFPLRIRSIEPKSDEQRSSHLSSDAHLLMATVAEVPPLPVFAITSQTVAVELHESDHDKELMLLRNSRLRVLLFAVGCCIALLRKSKTVMDYAQLSEARPATLSITAAHATRLMPLYLLTQCGHWNTSIAPRPTFSYFEGLMDGFDDNQSWLDDVASVFSGSQRVPVLVSPYEVALRKVQVHSAARGQPPHKPHSRPEMI